MHDNKQNSTNRVNLKKKKKTQKLWIGGLFSFFGFFVSEGEKNKSKGNRYLEDLKETIIDRRQVFLNCWEC